MDNSIFTRNIRLFTVQPDSVAYIPIANWSIYIYVFTEKEKGRVRKLKAIETKNKCFESIHYSYRFRPSNTGIGNWKQTKYSNWTSKTEHYPSPSTFRTQSIQLIPFIKDIANQ
jgi:hypothetical protein